MHERNERSGDAAIRGKTTKRGFFSFLSPSKRKRAQPTAEKTRISPIFTLRNRKGSMGGASEGDESRESDCYAHSRLDEPLNWRRSSSVQTEPSDGGSYQDFVMRPGIIPNVSPPHSILYPHGMYETGECPKATVEEIGKNQRTVPASLTAETPLIDFPAHSEASASTERPQCGIPRADSDTIPSKTAVQVQHPSQASGYDNWRDLYGTKEFLDLRNGIKSQMSSFNWGAAQRAPVLHTGLTPTASLSPLAAQSGSLRSWGPSTTHTTPIQGVARESSFVGRSKYTGPTAEHRSSGANDKEMKERIGKNDSHVQAKQLGSSAILDDDESDLADDEDEEPPPFFKIDAAIRRSERITSTMPPTTECQYRSRGESIGLPDCSEHPHVKAAAAEDRWLHMRRKAPERPVVKRSRTELRASGSTEDRSRICDYMSKLLSVDESGESSESRASAAKGKGKRRMRGETI